MKLCIHDNSLVQFAKDGQRHVCVPVLPRSKAHVLLSEYKYTFDYVPAHLATHPVGKWQTGGRIWEHFVQYADWTKCQQIGQNVGRWDVPSADVPSADWAKCSQMGPSADGTAHLPTLCSDRKRDGPSGNILSSMQIGQNFGRVVKM